jgi:importin subunit alpha-6/7
VFTNLLDHPKKSIRREVCWILSNICVGTPSQLQQLMACSQLLAKLAELYISGEAEIKREVSYVVGNICHSGTPAQAVFGLLRDYRLLASMVQFIMSEGLEGDGKFLEGGLFALKKSLELGDKLGGRNLVYLALE